MNQHTYQYLYTSTPEDIFVPPALPGRGARGQKLVKASKVFALIGIVILVVSFVPQVASAIAGAGNGQGSALEAIEEREGASYVPPFDPSLPKENRLVVPSIQVDTQINEASFENHEDALRKGVWRVSDFGTPELTSRPTIMAAHRYGYLEWDRLYRRHNSFFNLPKLEEGDRVEVIWGQRKYVYELYGIEQGKKINDYSADLILYTCTDLVSDIKDVLYLKLLEV